MRGDITGRTVVCGVIGDPVEHSMSPAMHNAAYRALGLDYLYAAFRVEPSGLAAAIAGMRALNIRGLNVTIPHKVAVMPLLDRLDPLAEKIEAVNTIVNEGGVLTGYNTDAAGFLQPLLEAGIRPAGKKVVIVGAGGAARAVSFILAENRAGLVILNRRREKAQELAGRIGKGVEALELDDENLKSSLEEADILVNVTPVGMSPAAGETPVKRSLLRPDLVVYDIVYNPIETRLLREAAAAGARAIGGIDMLAWQGAVAFEKFTGCRAPLELMRKEAVGLLEQKNAG